MMIWWVGQKTLLKWLRGNITLFLIMGSLFSMFLAQLLGAQARTLCG